MAFTTAFSLEALLFSSEMWARLPVGIVLAMMVLLITWCVGTTFEAKKDFSALGRAHEFKDRLVDFTRKLRGKASEHVIDVGDGGRDDGQDMSGMPNPTVTLKEAFSRCTRPRRKRASTASTLVNLTGSNRPFGSPDGTGVEMGKMDNKVPASVV